MTTHDEFAAWDAAYVLGALSPAERREFEAHLRECERCADAVGELAGMPGILSRVPREQAFALLDEDVATADRGEAPGPSADMLPSLLHRVRRRRVRARWLVAGLSAVTTAILIGIGAFVLPSVLAPAPAPVAAVVMHQVEPSPLSADLRLTSEPWGTRVESRCSYARIGGDSGHAWAYAMVVTDRSGHEHQVSTWTADEGTTATPVATISLPLKDIAAVDIRSADNGTVLLRSTFG
ncbi:MULTISPECIES: zf-HC2 domain-containing protein [unclassified Leifsonia]|uniref:zf-HC2 domain-containing protein n=1 Tax=unclassified Leifsonia TaxID=2663824 RepID=UPI0008A75778|nr:MULTISPECIES: zf-HC2 domain-containing protein [unclassified Leifsonia]SEI08704.1 Putative zinc-finger [Leifsonia sp. CL154]SFL83383.1 Putative zinc-finger [Leifsonia sp. CL147]